MDQHPQSKRVPGAVKGVAFAVALGGATQIQAQALEEIIVTAQKRQESVQNIGIAITALSGDSLKSLQINNAAGLADSIPSLRIESPSPVGATYTLRGVGQRDLAPHNEAAVVLFTDNAYVSFTGATTQPLYDIQRLEVLKGPQGTLFGRNATGGLIHVLSERPTEEFSGYVRVGFGNYNQRTAEGAVSGKIIDGVLGRLSLYTNHHDGYLNSKLGNEDAQEVENYAGRAQLLFQPSDDLEVLWNARYSKYAPAEYMNNKSIPLVPAGVAGNDLPIPVKPESYAQYAAACQALGLPVPAGLGKFGNCFFTDPDSNPHDGWEQGGFYENEYWGTTVSVDWSIDDVFSLASVTDYQEFTLATLAGSDATPLTLFRYGQGADAWQFSQELRLHAEYERGNWVAGVYYLKVDGDYYNMFGAANLAPGVDSYAEYSQTTESLAFFTQGEYDLTDEWTLIAGLRWTEDERTLNQPATLPFPTGVMAFDGLRDTLDKGDWSAKLELDWKPAYDTLIYASINRGIKSGGYNAGGSQFISVDEAPYDSETLVAYELGLKSTLFNNTTRLNAAVFHYDYRDYQTYSISPVGTLAVFNIDAEVDGAEIEITTRPLTGWEFQFAASYLDSKQKDVPYGNTVRDFQMPFTPELTLRGLARYEWDAFSGRMFAQLAVTWVDERTPAAIDVPALRVDEYLRADAAAGYTSPDERWNAELWVTNLTDEEIINVNTDFSGLTGGTSTFYEKPRMFGATFTYNW